MKITIAIPNFNGEKLLEKNLPNILDSGADEVLVLDDGSTDKSCKLLSNFKFQISNFKLLVNKKNLGFIPSVNRLFKEAIGDIVVLLNNDVWVEKDFLKPLVKHFEDESVFTVNLHEEDEGPGIAFWENGFYQFKRGEEKALVQKSAWASGGSAAFSKKIWQELGGFDKIFAPFYWEDIDISFRAIKKGFEILWEPNSKIKHEHETTIKKTFSQRYVNWVQQRNQLLFVWKNTKDKKLFKEHKKYLAKRLFSFKLGYWIPFIWALTKKIASSKTRNDERGDLEAINYAQNPTISVIIVSYNSENFIEKCITSLRDHEMSKRSSKGWVEIIVLDNASKDGTVKKLEKFLPKINLIKSADNLGFSKGNNRTAKQASGDYLFFLNPDTEIKGPIFEELIEFYKSTPDAGIIGPKLVMADGKTQPSVRKLPSVWGAIKEFIFGMKNAYGQYVPNGDIPVEVGMVYGAAMLIKRELFEKVGGFDEKFFLYYEDIDLCKRVRDLGKKVYYYPGVSIRHLVGATKLDQDKSKLNYKSSVKYHGVIEAFILQALFLIYRLRKRF